MLFTLTPPAQPLIDLTQRSYSTKPRSLLRVNRKVPVTERKQDEARQGASTGLIPRQRSAMRIYVPELLYFHSNILIIDDRRVIMGSANLNDRSQKVMTTLNSCSLSKMATGIYTWLHVLQVLCIAGSSRSTLVLLNLSMSCIAGRRSPRSWNACSQY
ncbi:hypothetical protein F4604DRAFT_578924 [Suillus subluteus]|nr:hypothetical protein F4604DRAFT_578924 [Suillus subluteus]